MKRADKPYKLRSTKHRNHYFDSDGNRYTQHQIDLLRTKAYKEADEDLWCHGCGQLAQGHAHIIPQARCKQIRKTELIWAKENFFPACHKCNLYIENPKGVAWHGLKNIAYCLNFMAEHDIELFNKFSVNGVLEI